MVKDISTEKLRQVLHYNPCTGIWTWKKFQRGVKQGARAGYRRNDGYLYLRVEGELYLSHRLAWKYVHGQWPENQIDHIDGLRRNDCFYNLRSATSLQNNHNSSKRSHNTSGYKGVSYNKRDCFWVAHIRINGRAKNLGNFNNPEDAAAAYDKAALEYFGVFAKTNNVCETRTNHTLINANLEDYNG